MLRQRWVRPASQVLEIGPQLGRVLISQLRLGLEQLQNNPIQLAIELRRCRRSRPVQRLRECPFPRCHLIQNGAEREQVAPSVDGSAVRLFRRHVGERAESHARLRQRVFADRRLCAGRGEFNRFHLRDELGQPEIEHLDLAAIGDENVGWLDIAVHDAFGVGSLESAEDLNAEAEDISHREPVALDAVLERLPVEPLHDDERPASCSPTSKSVQMLE